MHQRVVAALLAVFVVLALAACSGHTAAGVHPSSATTAPASGGATLAGGGDERPSGASAGAPSSAAPTKPVPVGVTERNADVCPFIATDDAAAAEGNRISSVSELVRGSTVIGCRFRFWCCDFHYTLEIAGQTYPDATSAYNAMVRLGQAGGEVIGVPSLAPAVDGVLYRTPFYQADGKQDWACSFAKGATVVTVKTDQNDTSNDALNVAKLIVGRF